MLQRKLYKTLAQEGDLSGRPGPSLKTMEVWKFFKVENNSLELTRIFKENIVTDCEREKKV